MISIKTPLQLKEVIEIAKLQNEEYSDAIYAIHKYKWYNWYQNLHIKAGTPEDIENSLIFNQLMIEYPKIHEDVEINISLELDKLYNDNF